METTASIRATLQENDWVAFIDLNDAYFPIPVEKKHQKYLWFTHRGAVYQYVALEFGLSTHPMIFTHERSEDHHTPQIKRGDLHVPKLLGPKNKVSSGTSKKHQCDIRSLQTARSRNKRRKTRAHSDSEIHLSGISVKHQLGRGLPTSNKNRGLDYISKPSTKTVRNDEPSGTHGLSRESHPMGKTLHERTAGRTSWLMAPGRIPRKPDCPDTTIQRRLTMVEGRMKLGGRATTATPAPQI